MAITTGRVLLEARGVTKYYERAKHPILVLDHIDLAVEEGTFVALLGPSGSGKSTLLRILSGLSAPTEGQVRLGDQPLEGVNPQVAMVFQTFALFPWLTVLQNVELGLEAAGLPSKVRRDRSIAAIDLIGLDGFENAYPKELSGGMRQRVGIARALVVEPQILMMDEPFSALDVLTAANLRDELLDLWLGKKVPMKAIVLVTHNIDEAVSMADRIVVLGRDPGRVHSDVRVTLPHPRDLKSEAAQQLVDDIYRVLTQPQAPAIQVPPVERYQSLPHVRIDSLNGLVELVQDRGGREDIFEIGRELQMEIDDLLPLVEAAQMLELARVEEGDIELTPVGERLAEGDIQQDKELFREQLTQHIQLIQDIMRRLEQKPEDRLDWEDLHDELQQHFSADEAADQLETAIDWGRYAELFAYDEDSRAFYLEPEPTD
ncbi:MAG TPA: nitrate/sulfonate/bicarbonate ABC transporter ATP-binding protein [Candidatus Dormibacteraeota bacterium]|jgi:NitT/TauT family transport system ATP-binding protein|nr:nitrate/sulfonate/bicarbonate ABC transporter ATP-binding protein [Candidatus Dormibacteraeota bacterium]